MPLLVDLQRQFGARVLFLGVAHQLNTSQNQSDVQKVTGAAHVEWPQFLEVDGASLQEEIFGKGVSGLPAFALFDREGRPAFTSIGSIDQPDNRTKLLQALSAVAGDQPKSSEGKK